MKTRKKLGQNWNQQYTASHGGSSATQQDSSGLTVLSASSKQLQLSSAANTTATNVWKKTEEVVEDAVISEEEEEEEKAEPEPETTTVPQPEIITTTVVTPSTSTNKGDSPELLISVAAWDEYGGRGTNKKNGKQPQLVETVAKPSTAPSKPEPTPVPPPQPTRKPRRGGRNNKKLQALKTTAQEPSRDSPKNSSANGGTPRKLFDPSTGSMVEFAPQSSSNNRGGGGGGGRDNHRHHGRGRNSNRNNHNHHHNNNNNGSNHHHHNGNGNSKRVTLLKESAPVAKTTAPVDEGDLKASAKSFSPRPAATEPAAEPSPGLDLDLDALVVTAPVSSTSQTNKSSNIFAFGSSGTWGAATGAADWSLD